MNIIPEVRNKETISGEYTFLGEYSFDKKEFPYVHKYLNTFLKITDSGEKIECVVDKALKREEYILSIDENIIITARDEEGIFRAAATLKQLARQHKIEKQKIHDYPMINNRGFMLDISRGRVPEFEAIIKLIDILRDVKYNQLQLYIDGLFFEYADFREYLDENCVITIEEMKKIKAYCDESFITLIPTQNGFGHMEKWIKLPEFSGLGIKRDDGRDSDTVNPLDYKSLELQERIYSNLLPYFDSEYINICMDEPFSLGMGQTKEMCEKVGRENVYVDYLNKLIALANEKYNKTPMFYDDVVIENEDALDRVDKNSIILAWGYELEWPYYARCEFYNRKGRRFYVCPSTCTFGSITGRFSNMAYNVEKAVKACIMYSGEGMLMTEWGDGGHPQCIAMSFVPAIFAASCSWNYKTSREIIPVNHLAYDRNSDIIGMCEAYADEFIFGKKGLSGLVHLMQNYYLLENHLKWSGTYIESDAIKIAEGKTGYLNRTNAKIIFDYMKNVREELERYDGAEYIEDIRLNCDMVIALSKYIYEAKSNDGVVSNKVLKAEFEEIKERFLKLWLKDNRNTGHDIYMNKLDIILKSFRE